MQAHAFDCALGVFERQSLSKRLLARHQRLAADMNDDAGDPATVVRGAAYLAGSSLMIAVDSKHIDPIDLEVDRIRRSPDHLPIRRRGFPSEPATWSGDNSQNVRE